MIIRTTLEKDHYLRYKSAAELRADLRRCKRDTRSVRMPAASGPVAAVASSHGRAFASSRFTALEIVPLKRGLPKAGIAARAIALLFLLTWGRIGCSHAPHEFNQQNIQIIGLTQNGTAGRLVRCLRFA